MYAKGHTAPLLVAQAGHGNPEQPGAGAEESRLVPRQRQHRLFTRYFGRRGGERGSQSWKTAPMSSAEITIKRRIEMWRKQEGEESRGEYFPDRSIFK